MLFDEPTSTMDIPSERALLRRLEGAFKDKTLILITHRPSLLTLVDRILILGHGAVAADGPRDEILAIGQQRPAAAPKATTVKAKVQAA